MIQVRLHAGSDSHRTARRSGRDLLDALARALRRSRPPLPPAALARLARPSLQRFAELRKKSVPALLDGVVDAWPGRANLELPRLRERFGNRVVTASPTRDSQVVCEARTGIAFQTVPLGDYLDRLERGDWPDTYVHGDGHTWLPELQDEVRPPEYCRNASWQLSRFWLSPPQMSSPLHRHGTENLFFQLIGRKRFYLYAPAATAWLYSNPLRSALPNFSRFDPEQADYTRFPLSRRVQPLEVILEPGDAIYLPSGWWHQVRSLTVSLSVNFFFADGVLAVAQRVTERLKRARRLDAYGLQPRLGAGGSPDVP